MRPKNRSSSPPMTPSSAPQLGTRRLFLFSLAASSLFLISVALANAGAAAGDMEREALIAELRAERQQLRDELGALREQYPDRGDEFTDALSAWQTRRKGLIAEWQIRREQALNDDAGITDRRPPPPALPEGADDSMLLRYQLRQEARAVLDAHAHLPVAEREEAILAWRSENEHRFEEARRLAEETDTAEGSAQAVSREREYSALSPEQRELLEEHDTLRAEGRAIADGFSPGQEEERQAALLQWQEANEERIRELRRLFREASQ